MDLIAFILAAIAAAVFLFGIDLRGRSNIGLGLTLLTVALICQFIGVSGHTVT